MIPDHADQTVRSTNAPYSTCKIIYGVCISSIYQRDAWLSIVACLLLQIFSGVLIYPAINSAFQSVSKSTIGFVSVIFILLLLVIYLSLRYGMINGSDFLLRGLDYNVTFMMNLSVHFQYFKHRWSEGNIKRVRTEGRCLSKVSKCGVQSFILILLLIVQEG